MKKKGRGGGAAVGHDQRMGVLFGMVPDRGVEQKEGNDQREVHIVEKRDGEDGGRLHGPGQRVPHVAQKHQHGVAPALRDVVGAVLLAPPSRFRLRQAFLCALRGQDPAPSPARPPN